MNEKMLGATPALGWNSWNTFTWDINEQLIRDVADKFITEGYKDAGYEYIVIDDCWSLKQRDNNGRLVADPKKFPSGMKALADYIHSKGLKFGMYSCVGTHTCAGYPGSFEHEFKTIDFSEITIILFSPELIGDFYMNFKGSIPNDNILHLEDTLNLKKLNSIYSQKSFLYAVCADLITQKTFLPVRQSPQTKVLYKILLYVEQNYSSDCTLKAIAKHLQYDYPYISKLFVHLMNMTFTDYLNRYRISQACYLLKNFNQSIGEIAISCGYSNLRTFHRNFRKITSQSPKEYRILD